ncbi:hypothetical protein [Desulfonatronospira sp.]|uniref:hypothetical protein n=1 Tax=Desulfonatronospira sp. TaxID=1962951 RepID=UPI0025C5E8F5|nr:hypothetical protein [Desulfonatronospira sp.]
MKNFICVAIVKVLLYTLLMFYPVGVFALEEGTGQSREDAPDSLIDQQTTRIMQMEDELHALERDMARRLAELEEQFSRQHTLLREYLEIHREEVQEVQDGLEVNETAIKDLQARMEHMDGSISEMQEVKGQLQGAVQRIDSSRKELNSRLQALSQKLSGIDAEYSEQLKRIGELGELQKSLDDFEKTIPEIESRIKAEMELEIEGLYSELSELEESLDTQKNLVQQVEKELRQTIAELHREIEFTDQGLADRLQETDAGLKELQGILEERTLYMGGAAALAMFLGFTGLAAGLFARRGRKKMQKNLEETSRALRKEMQDQQSLQDSKLVELLENLSLIMPEPGQQVQHQNGETFQEQDHTLALSLADEIYKLVKRARNLPEESEVTRDIKASLSRAFKALKNKGYEIVDLEGRQYKDYMEAKVEFVLTHELLPGEQVVSRVFKPLVKYRGQTIQKADIEVLSGD